MKTRRIGLVCLSVTCAVAALATFWVVRAQQPAAGPRATLFENARLIVGDASAPIERSAFVIVGQNITAIGKAGEIPFPAGGVRVDLTGKTVMPGFVDAHVHVGYATITTGEGTTDDWSMEHMLDHLDRFAYSGTSMVLSLGSDRPDFIDARYSDNPATFKDLRNVSEEDSFTGARYNTVGRGLAWPGTGANRSTTFYPVVSPWLATNAVRELAAQKVPFVKIWQEDRKGFKDPDSEEPAVLTPASLRAAVSEAHRLGLRTIGHIKTLALWKDTLEAGGDAATHQPMDLPVDAELLALAKAHPNFKMIPAITPSFVGGSAPRRPGQRPEWMTDPLLNALVCPVTVEKWGQTFEKNKTVPPPTGDLSVQNIATLYKAGVPVIFGSHDAGANRPLGWGSQMELEAFVNWLGMTPQQAIVSATSASADFLGVGDRLGRMAVGKGADFIVLDANPFDDIRNTRKISQVYLRGKKVDREGMKAKWAAQCKAAGL